MKKARQNYNKWHYNTKKSGVQEFTVCIISSFVTWKIGKTIVKNRFSIASITVQGKHRNIFSRLIYDVLIRKQKLSIL